MNNVLYFLVKMPQFDLYIIPSQSIFIFIFFFFYVIFLKYFLTIYCLNEKLKKLVEVAFKLKIVIGSTSTLSREESFLMSKYLYYQLSIFTLFDKIYDSANKIAAPQIFVFPPLVRVYNVIKVKTFNFEWLVGKPSPEKTTDKSVELSRSKQLQLTIKALNTRFKPVLTKRGSKYMKTATNRLDKELLTLISSREDLTYLLKNKVNGINKISLNVQLETTDRKQFLNSLVRKDVLFN